MRGSLTSIAAGVVCALTATACQHLPAGLARYVVRGSSARAPTNSQLASQYGCSSAQVQQNWKRAALAVARPGTPMCDVIGRYGEPVSVSASTSADMRLVSMIHRQADGRYYNATYVYYVDTKVNRRLRRPVAAWVVERVTVTR